VIQYYYLNFSQHTLVKHRAELMDRLAKSFNNEYSAIYFKYLYFFIIVLKTIWHLLFPYILKASLTLEIQ
jgi:hypothetical protein